jgi:hypothetical protein
VVDHSNADGALPATIAGRSYLRIENEIDFAVWTKNLRYFNEIIEILRHIANGNWIFHAILGRNYFTGSGRTNGLHFILKYVPVP